MSRAYLTYAFAALIAVGSSKMAFAQKINEHNRAFYTQYTETHTYTNASGQTMPYRLFRPRAIDPNGKYPLVLSFHGAGERGNDHQSHLNPWVAGWMDEEVQSKHPCMILMPQCPMGQQWVDIPWTKGSYDYSSIPISQPMKLAKEIFDKVVQEEPVDGSRIYVMGASMGGYGTWNFAMRYPELVAAAVPVCGAGDPAMADTIKGIPIWAFHGDKDASVPLSGSQDMVDAIKKAGGAMTKLTIYKGVGHESYKLAWREKEMIEWVFNQNKIDNKPNAMTAKQVINDNNKVLTVPVPKN